MASAAIGGLVVLALFVGLVLWFFGAYNGLVRLRQAVKSAWSGIDVQLKRRHDLIQNLVESVKGYLAHERQTLESVTKARAQAVSVSGGAQRIAAAENLLTQTLRSLFAVVERYPDLKANQNVMALQAELTATENQIAAARQAYNEQARQLNIAIETIPTSLVASTGGFTKAEFFQAEAGEKQAPQVKLT